jgi:hypothetical protein
MKRWLTTVLAVALCSAVLRADVTVVQTTAVEGGMAAMAGGANTSTKITLRVKGMKSRTEMAVGTMSVITIVDVAARQIIVLRPDQKTATVVSHVNPSTTSTATTTATTTAPTLTVSTEASINPTGKSQVIDGVKCDEYLVTTTMDMAGFAGAKAPPEAAAMLQGMKMNIAGSLWVAKDVPGAAEYIAYQKAAATSEITAAAASAAGIAVPGMDKMVKAMGSIDGLPYLNEMTMKVEGTGQMAEMLKQMGAMKVTTKVSSVSVDPISDDLFKIPDGYTLVKQ